MYKKYDWKLIQEDYNSGLSTRELIAKYGMSSCALTKAQRRKDITFRSKSQAISLASIKNPRKLSEETKKKISESRIKYLKEHPEKVPYRLNHSSKRSIPELRLEKAMLDHGITGFKTQFPMNIYQYDFAFVDEKLDVEVDGATHLTDNIKTIDERRDKWSIERGWRILRISASEIQKNIIGCINKILNELSKPLLPVLIEDKINKCQCAATISRYSKMCSNCRAFSQRRVERPDITTLLKEIDEIGYSAVGRKYGVSDNSIRKWIKKKSQTTTKEEQKVG